MTRRVLYTYPDTGYELREPIMSPWNKGDRVVIPKGTWIERMGRKDSGLSKRRSVVEIVYANEGYLTTNNRYDRLVEVPPQLCWAGSGGYWARCKVTDQMLLENNIPDVDLLVNTANLARYSHHLAHLTVPV